MFRVAAYAQDAGLWQQAYRIARTISTRRTRATLEVADLFMMCQANMAPLEPARKLLADYAALWWPRFVLHEGTLEYL